MYQVVICHTAQAMDGCCEHCWICARRLVRVAVFLNVNTLGFKNVENMELEQGLAPPDSVCRIGGDVDSSMHG
jgi:hypothetical protein